MTKPIRHKIVIFGTAAVIAIFAVIAVAASKSHSSFAVLTTHGSIALQERNLLLWALGLMLLIVIPVFALTFHIAWKYRAGNDSAHYAPNWDHNSKLETLWWGFPTAIILVLSIIIWQSSHTLDPYRPIAAEKDTMTIQVVALQWKWLFIYPDQDIASVNYLKLPQNKPVRFDITSDAPMNSFWIPQLGGQVYAMSGMRTSLHLKATEQGDFRGLSANLSGAGFADMQFVASSVSTADFNSWVQSVRQQSNRLSRDEYDRLAQPSRQAVLATYSSTEPDLQATIINKYAEHNHMTTMEQAR